MHHTTRAQFRQLEYTQRFRYDIGGFPVCAHESFPAWLRHQLDRREWKPAELARRAGVSSAMISRWINGIDVPSPESCIRIAEVLNVDPDDVLGIAGHRIPDRPLPPDDPISEIYRMMRRMKRTPDRVMTLRRIVEAYLETDGASQESRLLQVA
jgi:transcriptional regulator with XRE-family HTH domain